MTTVVTSNQPLELAAVLKAETRRVELVEAMAVVPFMPEAVVPVIAFKSPPDEYETVLELIVPTVVTV